MECASEAKKVSKTEFFDEDHDSIVNLKRFENLLTHFNNMIMPAEHSIIIKHQRKALEGYNRERVIIE